jgi:Family of unknown function (DUF6498)
MAKLQEKTASTAVRPIAPPPLSQHLRELASRPDTWAVIARNLIPVVGIYGFGWSAALAVFNYWFDGLTALIAIVTALIPRALRETRPKSVGAMSVKNLVGGAVTWIFLVGIIGLPYWIVLIPLHDLLLGNELRRQLAQSPALWLTFGSLAAGHFWKAFQSGYDTMPDNEFETASALGCVSPDTARHGHVHHGRAWPRLHTGAADGAAAELFRDMARASARRSLRRSVAAVRIRSGQSRVEPAPTLTALMISIIL